MRHLFFPTLFLVFFEASGQSTQGKLRNQLELFFDLKGQDSVLSLTRIGTGQLEAELKSPGEAASRKSLQSVPANALDKLLADAKTEGVPVYIREAPTAISAEEETEGRRSVSSKRKNRLQYVVSQSMFSSYAYGPAFVGALDLDGKAATSISLFAITGSIAAHSVFAYKRTFEDAHIAGMSYLAFSFYAASYLFPFMIMGPEEDAFRLGNALVLGAYPASLWLGYRHGERYVENPGRIYMEGTFTYPFAIVGGILLPLIYFGDDFDTDEETATRVMAGQALGFGLAGHFVSHLYRAGEHIPRGVPGGIIAHTVLGFMGGLTLNAMIEPDNGRTFGAILLAGSAAGFGEGLAFFNKRSDNMERSVYSGLGMFGGAAFGGGLLVLMEPDDPGPALTVLSLSMAAGYVLTYSLLKSQVESSAYRSKESAIRSISLDLIPIPDARKHADDQWAMGFRVPGLTVRF